MQFDAGERMHIWVTALLLALCWVAGCGDDDADLQGDPRPANQVVRERIAALAPAANLAHRGSGVNRASQSLPENSLAGFLAGMRDGADGIELDVELTSDGRLLILHDDTLDRTTTCRGCLSGYTFAQARACRLTNFSGEASDEPPPTLDEVFAVLPSHALVNVELKVYSGVCATPSTDAATLARGSVAEIKRLGVEQRTLFSSFSEEAAVTVKRVDPELYSAQLLSGVLTNSIARAVANQLDAIHPLLLVTKPTVAAIQEAGLQVNVWTVSLPADMQANLNKGVNAIITDEPALLRQVLQSRS